MDEQTEQPQPEQDDPGKDWRAEFFKAQKRHEKELEKAREEGRGEGQKAFERQATATELSTSLGFSKQIGQKFATEKADAEITEESLKTYITDELGLTIPEKTEGEQAQGNGQAQPQPPQTIGTNASAFHQQTSGSPVQGERLTPFEIKDRVVRGQMTEAQARAAVVEGRVDLNPQPRKAG